MSSDRTRVMAEAVGRRALQAQQTRRDIVDAARRIFAQRGYSVTSVKDIATEAGVSVQTVYDSVGRKPALLAALNDAIDETAQVAEIVQQAIAEGTTDALVALSPRITREILEHAGDIARIATNATATQPDLRQIREDGLARHRAGARTVCELLRKRRALRHGVPRGHRRRHPRCGHRHRRHAHVERSLPLEPRPDRVVDDLHSPNVAHQTRQRVTGNRQRIATSESNPVER